MRKAVILFTFGVLPLIMRLHFVEFPAEVLAKFRTAPIQADIFSWWKNCLLYSSAILLLCWRWKRIPYVTRLTYFYFALVVISSVLSQFPEVVWFGMPNYLEGTVAIGAYCILFLSAADIALETKSLELPLTFCVTLMFVCGSLQYLNPDWFSRATHWMVLGGNPFYQMSMQTWPLFGTMMNANVLGTFTSLAYAFFLARGKWCLTMITVVLAVGSQSRGAWFAMLVATIYLGLKYRTWRLSIPALFFAIGVALVYLHPTHGGMKLVLHSSGRVYVWRKTVSILSARHILYGDGPGAFAMQFPQDDAAGKIAQGWAPEAIVDRPHNFYVQVLHASGGISLVVLLTMFVGFLVKSKELAINAAVLSYLVNVFFTDSCTSVAPLFWIFLGTGVGRLKTGRIKNERSVGIEPRPCNS